MGLTPERVEALLGRLRALGEYPYGNLSEAGSIMRQAAATIAQLRAEVKRLNDDLLVIDAARADLRCEMERKDAGSVRDDLKWIYERAGKELWASRRRPDMAGHRCDYRGALHAVKDRAKRGLSRPAEQKDPLCVCGHSRKEHMLAPPHYCSHFHDDPRCDSFRALTSTPKGEEHGNRKRLAGVEG